MTSQSSTCTARSCDTKRPVVVAFDSWSYANNTPKNTEANFIKVNMHLGGAVNCRKKPRENNLTSHLRWMAFMYHIADLSSGLTHWGWATHMCVGKLTIIGSDNDLSPGRRQAIIWIIAGKLLIGPLGTNFSEILIEIITFSFMKIRLKVSSAKWRPCCLGLNVLTLELLEQIYRISYLCM